MQKSRGREPETFMLFDSREVPHSDDNRLCYPTEQGAAVQYALKFRTGTRSLNTNQCTTSLLKSNQRHQTTAIKIYSIRSDRIRYGPYHRRSRTVPDYDRNDDALIITETECWYSDRS